MSSSDLTNLLLFGILVVLAAGLYQAISFLRDIYIRVVSIQNAVDRIRDEK